MHYAANIFPPDDAPSRYLLLLACGDDKHEISTEATKVLYDAVHKNEGDKQDSNQSFLPDFQKLVIYIYSKMQTRMPTSSNGKVNVGSKVLPYSVPIFAKVIDFDAKIIRVQFKNRSFAMKERSNLTFLFTDNYLSPCLFSEEC